MEISVLVVGYNRPSTIRKSLSRLIKDDCIKRLYVAIDGPKISDDLDIVQEVRRTALELAGLHANAQFLISDSNLGCRRFMEKAITWFFSHEKAGIVLEDDIIVSPLFVDFVCKYIMHPSVSLVSGCSYPELVKEVCDKEAFLTRIPSIWGWATTREVWLSYMQKRAALPTNTGQVWFELCGRLGILKALLFSLCLRMCRIGELDTWDYPFAYYLIRNNMLTIMPAKRLAINIGFGQDATHNSNAHNPTLPWKEEEITEIRLNEKPKISFKYERMQSLNTPYYPVFKIQAVKGLIVVTLKKLGLPSAWTSPKSKQVV